MAMVVQRFEVYLTNLDPTIGHEIKKTRPCVIVSPDELNRHLQTLIVAPMTSVIRGFPSRVPCLFSDKKGEIVLDQIRTIDNKRLIKKLGELRGNEKKKVLNVLQEIFAE